MQIGSITLQVISGDITKEDTEVIVNISNPTFDATSGIILNMYLIRDKFVLVFRREVGKELSICETLMKYFSDESEW